MIKIRSTTPEGVMKSLWACLLVYNLICLLMVRQAAERGLDPRRLSFADAHDLMRHRRSDKSIPPIRVNPIRIGRDERRVIK